MSEQIYLSRLLLNVRSREARQDLADCMSMHRTLMNAFPDSLSAHGTARAVAGVLYRIETAVGGGITVIVRSALQPNWTRLPSSWLHPDTDAQVKEITQAIGRV